MVHYDYTPISLERQGIFAKQNSNYFSVFSRFFEKYVQYILYFYSICSLLFPHSPFASKHSLSGAKIARPAEHLRRARLKF